MKYQVFRNYTVELLFSKLDCKLSDYFDISFIDPEVDRYIWFYLPEISFGDNSEEFNNYLNMFEYVVKNIDKSKTIIAITAKRLTNISIDLINNEDHLGSYNKALYTISKVYKNVKVFDIDDFFNNYKLQDLIDWKYYFTSRIIINPKLSSAFNQWFVENLSKIESRKKKCLVLDLDNTLWGGVLGEDGISGIKIKGDYPGNVFELFQIFLLELRKSGVMLAICSKNNEEDVKELFSKNKNLILSLNDFVDWEINWNNKADNIVNLSKRLNIGLDSMVFIDDNPMERELVKQTIQGITVPDFPNDPYGFPNLLKTISDYFSTFNITSEDLNKTIQYKENLNRIKEKSNYSDLDSFINNLMIELSISEVDEFNIDRLVQLSQKTNQFNLTTKRYSKEDLIKLRNNGAKIFAIQIKDKFGDYGIVGLVIILFDQANNIAEIDTFLLSCRVLGKGVEHSIMCCVFDTLKLKSISKIEAFFFSTIKNSQVQKFYDQFGFDLIVESDDMKKYSIDIEKFKTPKKYSHVIKYI